MVFLALAGGGFCIAMATSNGWLGVGAALLAYVLMPYQPMLRGDVCDRHDGDRGDSV